MAKFIEHLYLICAILLAGGSQILVRWQIKKIGPLPESFWEKLLVIIPFMFKPWVLLAIVFTFFSAICWLVTLTKFELSYAYPWTSFLYIYLLLCGIFIFGDTVSFNKILGTLIIMVGIYFITK
jgi:drug/metabolite transporter (DMT)-like permease